MDRARDVERLRHPEVSRHSSLQQSLRSTPIRASSGCAERGEAYVGATAPITGDRTERQEAGATPIGRYPNAVDSSATYDRDSPSTVGPRTQQCERVVVDHQAIAPVVQPDLGPQRLELVREVGASDQYLGRARNPWLAGVEPCSPQTF